MRYYLVLREDYTPEQYPIPDDYTTDTLTWWWAELMLWFNRWFFVVTDCGYIQ